MNILATRAIGDSIYAVLDGDGDVLVPGDRLTVAARATLRVTRVGVFPVCELTRLQTGVSAAALVGMEASVGD